MDYRIFWVHGIGPIPVGYSQPWDQAYNEYLNFPAADFWEGYWADVFNTQDNLDESFLRNALTTVFLARAMAQIQDQGGIFPWVVNPDAYVGEFVKYLVNRDIRTAVKEKVKAQLRPLGALANGGCKCSIIAHSWGTVVTYESLLDLEAEMPAFQLANLFTLGCPLWLVQHFLDDASGRKPHNVAYWANIHAQGDPVGAGLTPAFQVTMDYPVATYGNMNDPHGSYFVADNVAVQRDIVAATIIA